MDRAMKINQRPVAMRQAESRVKCLKCQTLILEKDVPKRCPMGTPLHQSHAAALGWDFDLDGWQAPYGVTDLEWAEALNPDE